MSLDFINTGNGDSFLLREMEGDVCTFAAMVDCGHINLIRDDHPTELDHRSQRIYAGDFLTSRGVKKLDLLVLTHFHRDHAGGLGRVLDAVPVEELMATYIPPEDKKFPDLELEGVPKAAKGALRCLEIYSDALSSHPGRIQKKTVLPWTAIYERKLTEDLSMEILFSDPSLYERQMNLYDRAMQGDFDAYEMIHWSKCMNVSSLRVRFSYHGKDVLIGGDLYAHMWETYTTRPCEILKVPHHGSISGTTRHLLELLNPKTAVISAAARRPDEQPHPYTVQMIKDQVKNVYFTDAVEIPGVVEPEFHQSVHLELD